MSCHEIYEVYVNGRFIIRTDDPQTSIDYEDATRAALNVVFTSVAWSYGTTHHGTWVAHGCYFDATNEDD